MAEFFSNPGVMSTEQLLAICILGFIMLAILVMIHRLLAIMKMSRKQTYQPNFRRFRKFHSTSSDVVDQESEPVTARKIDKDKNEDKAE